MTTISVPIPQNLEDFINRMIESGEAETKAEVVRYALRKYAEDEVITSVLQSRREIEEGKVLSGNLKDLVKEFRKQESKHARK
ncbi:MAG: type II toxin-antitoxin system ParD family antitoxin [Candidatus Paceibacterota bacterium]